MPTAWMTGLFVFYAALMGLLIGSFLNVCIYRLPAHETITRGRSYCPRCHHDLRGADLVPVVSYLVLGRRCRYCHEPISPRYARIELLTAAFFILTAWLWSPAQTARLQAGQPLLSAALWGSTLQTHLQVDLAAWVQSWPPEIFSLSVILLSVACFCALLVRSMIIWDRGLPPVGLYWFIFVPGLLRLLVQPDRWINQLAGMIFAVLFQMLMQKLCLVPPLDRSGRLHEFAGSASLGLMAGLMAVQSVLAVYLVVSVLAMAWQKRNKRSDARIEQLRRSLPLLGTWIGAVAWLLF